MDNERVMRSTLPQVTVGMPLSLLTWVDEQAKAAGVSRSKWIVNLIASSREDSMLTIVGQEERMREMAGVS